MNEPTPHILDNQHGDLLHFNLGQLGLHQFVLGTHDAHSNSVIHSTAILFIHQYKEMNLLSNLLGYGCAIPHSLSYKAKDFLKPKHSSHPDVTAKLNC